MTSQFTKVTLFSIALAVLLVSGCSSNEAEENHSLANGKQNNKQKVENKGVSNKIDQRIAKLMEQEDRSELSVSNTLIKSKESQVQVYIVVKSADESDIILLKSLGLEVEIINAKLRKIQGWVALNKINLIAELDNVLAITTPSYAIRRR